MWNWVNRIRQILILRNCYKNKYIDWLITVFIYSFDTENFVPLVSPLSQRFLNKINM